VIREHCGEVFEMSSLDSNPFLPIRLIEIPRNESTECGENLSIELLSNDHHICLISAKIKRRIELLHRALPAIRRSMKNLWIAAIGSPFTVG
jgi:hypothetical protein